MEYFSYQAN